MSQLDSQYRRPAHVHAPNVWLLCGVGFPIAAHWAGADTGATAATAKMAVLRRGVGELADKYIYGIPSSLL